MWCCHFACLLPPPAETSRKARVRRRREEGENKKRKHIFHSNNFIEYKFINGKDKMAHAMRGNNVCLLCCLCRLTSFFRFIQPRWPFCFSICRRPTIFFAINSLMFFFCMSISWAEPVSRALLQCGPSFLGCDIILAFQTQLKMLLFILLEMRQALRLWESSSDTIDYSTRAIRNDCRVSNVCLCLFQFTAITRNVVTAYGSLTENGTLHSSVFDIKLNLIRYDSVVHWMHECDMRGGRIMCVISFTFMDTLGWIFSRTDVYAHQSIIVGL